MNCIVKYLFLNGFEQFILVTEYVLRNLDNGKVFFLKSTDFILDCYLNCCLLDYEAE